ncbi:MAG: hypothetical protein LC808_28365, partial [Actinobacteria bacterium]|nr:hypothetical protein [Actinomycetota bacterium]
MGAGCVFCGIWSDHEEGAPREPCDTPLADLGPFFLLPALGPLVAGHVLVVGKTHAASLAALGPHAIEEYERIADCGRERLGSELLEAEHGSDGAHPGGACIDHVHVALIPGRGLAVTMLDGQLPLLTNEGPLASVLPVDRPYVFLRGNGRLRVFDGAGVPSQLVRREIARLDGHEEWDWALFDRSDLLEESVAIWQAALLGPV